MPANSDFMPDALFWAENSDPTVGEPLDSEIGDRLSDTEVRLLGVTPASPAEMVVQLEIVCEGLEGGGRSDGLDLQALRQIQAVLAAQEAEELTTLQQFNALRRRALDRSGPET